MRQPDRSRSRCCRELRRQEGRREPRPSSPSTSRRVLVADSAHDPRRRAALSRASRPRSSRRSSAPVKKAARAARARASARASSCVELENQDLAGAAAESRAVAESRRGHVRDDRREPRCRRSCRRRSSTLAPPRTRSTPQQSVFDNRQRLYQEGAIAQKDVNDAQVALSQARTSTRRRRNASRTCRAFARDQAAQGRGGAARCREGPQRRRRRRSLATRASRVPIDGVVTDLPLYPGETAPSGAPVVTVMDLSQRDRAHPRLASPTRRSSRSATTPNLIGPGGAPIPAKVTLISPALDAASTTVEVWVRGRQRGRQAAAGRRASGSK